MFKIIKRLTSVWSTFYINFFTSLRGTKVGQDQFGNTYFKGKARRGYTHERRWVIYKGTPEASKIPPEWHGWIHHQTDLVPLGDNPYRQSWQRPHKENKTGTKDAYMPPGHLLKGGQRDKATGDYQAWQPK